MLGVPFASARAYCAWALSLMCFLVSLSQASAEYIPPGEVEIKTKRYDVKDNRFTTKN